MVTSKPSGTNCSKLMKRLLSNMSTFVDFKATALNLTRTIGVYCGKVHLFPFRTEKLSLPTQMVLLLRESMSTPPWGPFGGLFFCSNSRGGPVHQPQR